MELIRKAHLEKIARDAGFDRLPRQEGDWLVLGSSHFGEEVLVRPGSTSGATVVALAARPRPHSLSGIHGIVATDVDQPNGSERREGCIATTDAALSLLLGSVAAAARERRDRPLDRFQKRTATLPKVTEAERIVVVRIGQDVFRDALVEYWDGACAVLGLNTLALLRASHSKPWAECESDAERLDVFNGFLLAPHLDAAFDGGWITFDDDGRVRISGRLPPDATKLLAIDSSMRLRRIEDAHKPYLAYHRERVFQP